MRAQAGEKTTPASGPTAPQKSAPKKKNPTAAAGKNRRAAPRAQSRALLAEEIINIMEQGIIVWSAEGTCLMHNARVFEVLELPGDFQAVGKSREDIRALTATRGEVSTDDTATLDIKLKMHQPYSFEVALTSGRTVLSNGRPTRGGGYVVTFTDVTQARQTSANLAKAKAAAEDAEKKAKDFLAQEQQRQGEAQMLAQLDEWLQSCKSLEELYRIVARFMSRLLPGSKGELYIYSNSRDGLDGICNWNTTDLHHSIDPDSCWALRRGRSYQFESEGLCFICEHVESHGHNVEVNEYICVPIIAHGDTVGLLHIRFDISDEGSARVEQSSAFAVRCAEHIAMAIANVKLRDELHDQSIRDPLTRLYNRRYFMDALRREMATAKRLDGHVGLISFDADRFKRFNDQHGHDAGDTVLHALSEAMLEQMAKDAICCRTGGEEFHVILPGRNLEQTMKEACKLRALIASNPVRYLNRPLPAVTISCGCAAYPGNGMAPQPLIVAADEALYRAKNAGRDSVRPAE
ncbi:MAG: diguanylate cyclase [Rhodobacteraceae bacterium]|nr:diguanylate cyclase [Paracoccaceae bacterium]